MKTSHPHDCVIGWAIVRVSTIADTSGLNLTFNKVQSEGLFPGLKGQTVHFEAAVYRRAFIWPAAGEHVDNVVTFERKDMPIFFEHGKEYAVLISVDREQTIWIKCAALKVHLDAALRHVGEMRDSNKYHVKFAGGQSFTGSFERLYKAAILQVGDHPEAFLSHPENEWYIKEPDGEFHRILVFPRVPEKNPMFIAAVLRGGVKALPKE